MSTLTFAEWVEFVSAFAISATTANTETMNNGDCRVISGNCLQLILLLVSIKLRNRKEVKMAFKQPYWPTMRPTTR